jgi:hypothetical protein
LNIARRLQQLETDRRVAGELRVLRLEVRNYGSVDGRQRDCIRTRCPNGLVMALVDVGLGHNLLERAALEGFPIEPVLSSGFSR